MIYFWGIQNEDLQDGATNLQTLDTKIADPFAARWICRLSKYSIKVWIRSLEDVQDYIHSFKSMTVKSSLIGSRRIYLASHNSNIESGLLVRSLKQPSVQDAFMLVAQCM